MTKEEMIQKIEDIIVANTEDKEEVNLNIGARVNNQYNLIRWIRFDSQYNGGECQIGYNYYAYETFGGLYLVTNDGLRDILKYLKSIF